MRAERLYGPHTQALTLSSGFFTSANPANSCHTSVQIDDAIVSREYRNRKNRQNIEGFRVRL